MLAIIYCMVIPRFTIKLSPRGELYMTVFIPLKRREGALIF